MTLRKIIALALVLAVAACATAPASRGIGAGAASLLYVCNQNDATVSVIDTRTNTVVRTVDLQKLGFSANAKPHHVQVEPDGSFWYVTLIGENRIVKLDRNDRVVASATFETPGMLSLDVDNSSLFVGRSMTAVNPPHRIGVVDRTDMSIEEVEVMFPRPHAMALQRATNMVYTASLGVNQIAAMEAESEAVTITDVPGPQHSLMQFAISPDGRTLVVSAELSAKLIVFDIATDPKHPRLVRSIDVGAQPFDPVFTRDGRWIYLGNKMMNTITAIDTRDWSVASVIKGQGISQPHGTAVSADGRWVYVSNNNLKDVHAMPGMTMPADHQMPAAPSGPPGNGTVVVIDAATHKVVKVIEVGHNAAGIAVAATR